MPIFIFIALYFLADLIALILLGGQIGVLATLLLIIGTAVLGIQLIRREGMQALRNAQLSLLQGRANPSELIRGSTLVIAGFMLLLPGPLSDLVGLCCLVPLLIRRLRGNPPVEPYHPGRDRTGGDTFHGEAPSRDERAAQSNQTNQGQTIEGEYIEHKHRD